MTIEKTALQAPPRTFRAAVDAMCKQCIYDPYAEGNWRQQVQACTAPTCPLYALRPVSKPKKRQGAADV